MNGKTHQVSGTATTLAATCLTVEYANWIRSNLPEWLASILTPPQELLITVGNARATSAISISSSSSSATTLSSAASAVSGQQSQSLDLGSVLAGSAGSSPGADIISNIPEVAISTTGILLILLIIGLIGLVSGQFPDMDTPDATISNSFRAIGRMFKGMGILGLVLRLIFWALNFLPYTAAVIANKFFGHRGGVIHGPVGWFGFSGLFWLLTGSGFYGFLFWVGYATHLLVDALSRSGIKILWPISDRDFHLLPEKIRFRTKNPLHNATAQSGFVLVSAWSVYFLLSKLLPFAAASLPFAITSNNNSNSNSIGGLSLSANQAGSGLLQAAPFIVLIMVFLTVVVLLGIWISGAKAYPAYRREMEAGTAFNY